MVGARGGAGNAGDAETALAGPQLAGEGLDRRGLDLDLDLDPQLAGEGLDLDLDLDLDPQLAGEGLDLDLGELGGGGLRVLASCAAKAARAAVLLRRNRVIGPQRSSWRSAVRSP